MAESDATFNIADPTAPGHFGPSQTALLLLDFHSMFVERLGGTEAQGALETAAKVRTWAKSKGITVVHCLIDAGLEPFPTCKGFQRLSEVRSALEGPDGAEPTLLTEGVSEDEPTFVRRAGHVSALKSPGLRDFFNKNDIKSLILTGLSTSGCVMRTSITACDDEYVTTVISDACADPVDGVHDMMVGKILNNRGYVTTAAEFMNGYEKTAASN